MRRAARRRDDLARGAAGRGPRDGRLPGAAAAGTATGRRLVLPRPLRAAAHADARRAASAHRASDRDVAVRRRGAPPRHRRQRRDGATRRLEPHDQRRRHRPFRVLARRRRRRPRRPAAVGRPPRVASPRCSRVRASRGSADAAAGGRDRRRRRGDGRARTPRRCRLARIRLHADRRRRTAHPRRGDRAHPLRGGVGARAHRGRRRRERARLPRAHRRCRHGRARRQADALPRHPARSRAGGLCGGPASSSSAVRRSRTRS